MYQYYQQREEGTWKPIPASNKATQIALDHGAKKLTILAMSEQPDEYTTNELITYKGPLYFDIDCKEDIHFAIRSTRELVKKLLELDVKQECILVFCSGSKGMHVIVDERAFSTGRAVKGLPKVYREIAKEVYVFGLDWQVYSGGKGVCWRLVNVQRSDGKYRVGITHEELNKLTEVEYALLVSAPRTEIKFPKEVEKGHATGLAVLFENCKKEVVKQVGSNKQNKGVSNLSSESLKTIQKEAPQCVKDLCNGKASNSANFNNYALQLAAYIANAGVSDQLADKLAGELADSTSSSSYRSSRDRVQHIRGLCGYCSKAGKGYNFSCGGIKNVISTNPCAGCPLNNKKTEAQREADNGGFGIEERDNGYYMVGKEVERRITTFTMGLVDRKFEREHDLSGKETCVGTKIEVQAPYLNCNGKVEMDIPEEAWMSKQAFLAAIKGHGQATFTGNDGDMTKLKTFIFAQQGEHIGRTTTVPTVGITTEKVGTSDIMVYVEKEGSLNQLGVRGTHEISAYVQNSPELLSTRVPKQGDADTSKALLNLMRMNSKKTMGLILGWHAAAHLRTHFIKSCNQFPTLNIWGPAGVGKTQTAMACCFLNGIDYTGNHSPLLVPSSTKFAMEDFCSSSTTIPRILDEANQSRMSRQRWQEFVEISKAVFGNLGVHKGRKVQNSIVVGNRPMSAPLVTLAEQNLADAAAVQRSISVFLTTQARRNKECYAAFETSRKLRPKLLSLSKALMLRALKTKVSDAQDMADKYLPGLPLEFEDRVRFGFTIVLAGLDFLKATCESLELTPEISKEIEALKDSVFQHITKEEVEILQVKSKSEVDRILEVLGQMASLTLAGATKDLLLDEHYTIQNGNLVLDLPMAYAMYINYSNRSRLAIHIKDFRGFHALLKEEYYFMEEVPVKGFKIRPCVILDGEKLTKKGIDLTMFGGNF